MEENRIPRKRVPNFTPDEKLLLMQLIKKRPILESKLTDGTTVWKKRSAWVSLTEEFNSNACAYKRDTSTLKTAWDNIKAIARKTRAAERDNLMKTGGGPSSPPHPPQQRVTISIVDEPSPVKREVRNSFDSDGSVLLTYENEETEEIKVLVDEIFENGSIDITDSSEDSQTLLTETGLGSEQDTVCEAHDMEFYASAAPKSCNTERAEQCKPSDYERREALVRLKHLMAKNKIEMQILNAKLETEAIKKRVAEMEEERNRTLLEMSKLELAELKKRFGK